MVDKTNFVDYKVTPSCPNFPNILLFFMKKSPQCVDGIVGIIVKQDRAD
jgi:hypothetical protein